MKCFAILKLALVLALVMSAAALATPKGRVPLAVRGIRRLLRRDRGLPPDAAPDGEKVPASRRVAAFLLVVAALALALTF